MVEVCRCAASVGACWATDAGRFGCTGCGGAFCLEGFGAGADFLLPLEVSDREPRLDVLLVFDSLLLLLRRIDFGVSFGEFEAIDAGRFLLL